MIECSNKNVWYIKRRRHKKGVKRLFSCFFLCFFIILGVFYYKNVTTKRIISLCSDTAYSYSTQAINNAVSLTLSDKINYENLIDVQKNSNGDVIYMSANTYKINKINTSVAKNGKSFIEKELKNGIKVPILAFLGIDIISGYGREINFKSLSVSSVKCDFSSEFASVGINQTKHTLYLIAETEIFIDIPLNRCSRKFDTKVLISESVIVGNVPDIYLSGKLFA